MVICSLIACQGKSLHEKREQELRFLKNGARLLQELISTCEDKVKYLQFFSAKELTKATNNYDEKHILGSRNIYNTYLGSRNIYTAYKGTYNDRTIVIRRSDSGGHNEYDIDCIFNEIVMLSQINHRNVVKILGGCFETTSPMLVYEFMPNGSLYHHIHEKDLSSGISWENRLRIATEVAYAIAYLHTASSKPIVHRDIKSSTVLLDKHYTAKVIDLQLSVSIPLGKTHVKSAVVGTLGSIDPDYNSTGQVTEKCDVYSFGVLLLELLTGKKTFEWSKSGESNGFVLVDFAVSYMKEKRIHLIIDTCIFKERNMEQVMACAELAMKCIKLKREERPTMKEVVQELRQIKKNL